MSEFEDRYLDVLQNIEFAVMTVYREKPELTDFEADKALKALILEYQSEEQGREFIKTPLGELSDIVYDRVKMMCEWRLGRASPFVNGPSANENEEIIFNPRLLSLNDAILCLKRIRKSIEKWNKRGGRRGYLQFVEPYVR